MKKLLIIRKQQFGYHTDIYKWCQYLNDKYKIDLVCFDEGQRKFVMNNVNVHYVSKCGSKKIRGLHYILCCIYYVLFFKGIVIVSYFHGCHYIKKILPWKKMVLDIRTFNVSSDESVRMRMNKVIMKTVELYDFVTIISEGLRSQLPKDKSLTALLPLGGDIIDTGKKDYESIDLLYVGTFQNRKIEKTIEGFAIAKKQMGERIHYHIIGKGFKGEDEQLKSLSERLGVAENINFYGYLPHDKLLDFYHKCNVGVSFIPITSYFDYQPPTKTFEYIMAGLYTIATATYSNKEVITSDNGILINDTSDDFADGILRIAKLNDLDGDKIRNSLNQYQWSSIVNGRMVPILEHVEQLFGYIND